MLKGKKKHLLIFPVLLLILGFTYYFCYWIRTPLYAVNQVREAVKQHDVVKFNRYVDSNALLNKAYEDVITAESMIHHDDITKNPFAMGVLHFLKPTIVDLMTHELEKSIVGKDSKASSQNPDPVSNAMKNNIKKQVQLKDLQLKSINLKEHKGENADVILTLYNKALQKNFTLQLKMTLDDDTWRITEINNLVDFIIDMDTAKQLALSAKIKPIQEELERSLKILNKKLVISSEEINGKKIQVLEATITVRNATNKIIERIYYDIDIYDKNKEVVYSYPAHFAGKLEPNGIQVLTTAKKLNIMLPADKMVMELNLSQQDWSIDNNFIRFEDGTILQDPTSEI